MAASSVQPVLSGETVAPIASMNSTRGFENTKDFDSKQLETTIKENMSLIDRFYNGGNRARAEALDILVVVLDSVVQRMREMYSRHKKSAQAIEDEFKSIDAQIAAISKLQAPLAKELAEKKARAKELEEAVGHGNEVIQDSVTAAREALAKAQLAQRSVNTNFAAGMKLNNKGVDDKGRPLPGVLEVDDRICASSLSCSRWQVVSARGSQMQTNYKCTTLTGRK